MYTLRKLTKFYTGFSNSGSGLIIKGTALDSVSKIGDFINNLQSLSSHCDGWLNLGLSRY